MDKHELIGNFINGEWSPSKTGKTAQNINPATGESLGEVTLSDKADAEHAIAVAKAANKAIGILSTDGNAAKYLEQGATLVGVGTDVHVMVRAADELAARFKDWQK